MSGEPGLRIVYFGTPGFAVPGLTALLESRHPVVALVSQPDRPKGRGHRSQPTPTRVVAEAAGVPVFQPTKLKDPAFHEQLRTLAPDLGVVAAYGRLLPDALLALPRLGMINIHASLLPRYRGAAPVHRAVINGDAETGVTIMRVVTELDAGPMFARVRLPVDPDATTPEVESALAAAGARLVLDVIDQMARGTATEQPQDHAAATHAPKIERHEGAIPWSLSANEIHNRVRGLQPWPLVSAMIGGVRCLIHRTSVTDDVVAAAGGTITAAADGVLAVAAGDGRVVRILTLQPEGKRTMSARDFLAGRRVAPGMLVAPPG